MIFNKNNFNVFREDVEAALKDVAKKHNIQITCGNISYSDIDFTLQLDCVNNQNGEDGKKILFEKYCSLYGFEKSDYEREFNMDNKRFKLVGFNPNSPKNNCTIVCINNDAAYKCNDSVIKLAFATQK